MSYHGTRVIVIEIPKVAGGWAGYVYGHNNWLGTQRSLSRNCLRRIGRKDDRKEPDPIPHRDHIGFLCQRNGSIGWCGGQGKGRAPNGSCGGQAEQGIAPGQVHGVSAFGIQDLSAAAS